MNSAMASAISFGSTAQAQHVARHHPGEFAEKAKTAFPVPGQLSKSGSSQRNHRILACDRHYGRTFAPRDVGNHQRPDVQSRWNRPPNYVVNSELIFALPVQRSRPFQFPIEAQSLPARVILLQRREQRIGDGASIWSTDT